MLNSIIDSKNSSVQIYRSNSGSPSQTKRYNSPHRLSPITHASIVIKDGINRAKSN